MRGSRVKSVLGFLLFLLLAAALVYFLLEDKGVRRGIKGIPEPKQTEASGGTSFEMSGYDVNVSYMAAYEIEALVVHTHDYTGLSLGDRLAPVDLGLAWGKVAEYNDRIDFHWEQANRWLNWHTDSYSELQAVGGEDAVLQQASNNHIIPATGTVRKAVKKIKMGDRVRLKGYLVNLNAEKSNGATFTWSSSLTRDDTGNHACELFYVTGVEVEGEK